MINWQNATANDLFTYCALHQSKNLMADNEKIETLVEYNIVE